MSAEPTPTVTCVRCGAPLRPEGRFCPSCGAAALGPVALDLGAVLADPDAQERLPEVLRAQLAAVHRARSTGKDGGAVTLVLADGGRGAERLVRRMLGAEGPLPLQLGPALDDEQQSVAHGAALVAAGAVLLVTSALQLLGASEQARLTAAAAAARCPVALVVLRMDACEDASDVAALRARATPFAEGLGCPILWMDGDEDAAAVEGIARLRAEAARRLEPSLAAVLADRIDAALACVPAPSTAELAAAEHALDEADTRAHSAARGQLDAGGAVLRGAWPARLRAMDAEARTHEAPHALERDINALWADVSRRHLRLLLDAVAAEPVEDAGASLRLDPAPSLSQVGRARSPSLLAAAALTTVGVLLLPGASPAVAAAGLSLVAGSLLGARVVRHRQDDERGRLHEHAVLAWIDQGVAGCAAALDAQSGHWRSRLRASLRSLHAAGGDPGTERLRMALQQLRAGVVASTPERAGPAAGPAVRSMDLGLANETPVFHCADDGTDVGRQEVGVDGPGRPEVTAPAPAGGGSVPRGTAGEDAALGVQDAVQPDAAPTPAAPSRDADSRAAESDAAEGDAVDGELMGVDSDAPLSEPDDPDDAGEQHGAAVEAEQLSVPPAPGADA